jgi:ABC-2 type transport system ATP-binding protein
LAAALADLPSVNTVRPEGGGFSLAAVEPHVALPALLARLQELGRAVMHLSTRHVSLEDVFVTLTGRHLRDDEPAR